MAPAGKSNGQNPRYFRPLARTNLAFKVFGGYMLALMVGLAAWTVGSVVLALIVGRVTAFPDYDPLAPERPAHTSATRSRGDRALKNNPLPKLADS